MRKATGTSSSYSSSRSPGRPLWSTILNKRAGYQKAFAGFDPEAVARFGART